MKFVIKNSITVRDFGTLVNSGGDGSLFLSPSGFVSLKIKAASAVDERSSDEREVLPDGAPFPVTFLCRVDSIADNGLLENVMAIAENPHRKEPPTEVDRVVEVLSSVMAK